MPEHEITKSHEWRRLATRPVFSPTQISMYRDCQRQWGFRYIRRIKAPPSRHQQFGLDVHNINERWLKYGMPPPQTLAGYVYKTAMRFLPPPGRCTVEGKFDWLPDNEVFAITGIMDVLEIMADGVPRVDDLKTTGDFRWMLSPEDLREDPQCVTYVARTAAQLDVDVVRARWIYMLRAKRTRPARPVDIEMRLPEIAEAWEGVAATCREMVLRLEQKARPEDLPQSLGACGKYNGCPYEDICGITPQERFAAAMTQMTLKEKLLAQAGQQPAINPPENAQVQQALPPAAPPGPQMLPAPAPAAAVLPQQPPPVAPPGPQMLPTQAPVIAPTQAPVLQPPMQAPPAPAPQPQPQPQKPSASIEYQAWQDIAQGLALLAKGVKALADERVPF